MLLALLDSVGSRFPEKQIFCQSAKGLVYGNLGIAHYYKGDTAFAEKLMKQSIDINKRGDERMYAQGMRLKPANLHLVSDRLPEVGALLQEIRRSLDTLKNEEQEWSG